MKLWNRFTKHFAKNATSNQTSAAQQTSGINPPENGLRRRASRHFLRVRRSTTLDKHSSEASESDATTSQDLTLLPTFGFEENTKDDDWVGPSEDALGRKIAHEGIDELRLGELGGNRATSPRHPLRAMMDGDEGGAENSGPLIDEAWARLLQEYSPNLDLSDKRDDRFEAVHQIQTCNKDNSNANAFAWLDGRENSPNSCTKQSVCGLRPSEDSGAHLPELMTPPPRNKSRLSPAMIATPIRNHGLEVSIGDPVEQAHHESKSKAKVSRGGSDRRSGENEDFFASQAGKVNKPQRIPDFSERGCDEIVLDGCEKDAVAGDHQNTVVRKKLAPELRVPFWAEIFSSRNEEHARTGSWSPSGILNELDHNHPTTSPSPSLLPSPDREAVGKPRASITPPRSRSASEPRLRPKHIPNSSKMRKLLQSSHSEPLLPTLHNSRVPSIVVLLEEISRAVSNISQSNAPPPSDSLRPRPDVAPQGSVLTRLRAESIQYVSHPASLLARQGRIGRWVEDVQEADVDGMTSSLDPFSGVDQAETLTDMRHPNHAFANHAAVASPRLSLRSRIPRSNQRSNRGDTAEAQAILASALAHEQSWAAPKSLPEESEQPMRNQSDFLRCMNTSSGPTAEDTRSQRNFARSYTANDDDDPFTTTQRHSNESRNSPYQLFPSPCPDPRKSVAHTNAQQLRLSTYDATPNAHREVDTYSTRRPLERSIPPRRYPQRIEQEPDSPTRQPTPRLTHPTRGPRVSERHARQFIAGRSSDGGASSAFAPGPRIRRQRWREN